MQLNSFLRHCLIVLQLNGSNFDSNGYFGSLSADTYSFVARDNNSCSSKVVVQTLVDPLGKPIAPYVY